MAFLQLYLQDFDVGVTVRLDVEILTLTIMADVDDHGSGRRRRAVLRYRSDPYASTDFFEFGYEQVGVHTRMDTKARGKVRAAREATTPKTRPPEVRDLHSCMRINAAGVTHRSPGAALMSSTTNAPPWIRHPTVRRPSHTRSKQKASTEAEAPPA